ncbi:MAG: TonB-dependent receptor [Candidatus Eisenbacteria sp.]|nr:TonB-dependent receptor [Candidatus Eisenbacteria bacterium]
MNTDERAVQSKPAGARRHVRFTSREIALLGLMAALWGVIEITVGGMIKTWHIPFGGSFLSTFGVVILLTARGSVPRKWSSILIGVVAAGVRLASGFGGAVFAAIGIVAEALIVEFVLSLWSSSRLRARMLAGILAVTWAMVHPFVVQGYMAGLGPAKVYSFTIGLIVGQESLSSGQAMLVFLSLLLVHAAMGVCAVLFVDRIMLAPYARAHRSTGIGGRDDDAGGSSSGGGNAALRVVLVATLLLAVGVPGAQAQQSESSRVAAGVGPAGVYWLLPEFTVVGSRLFGPYSVFEVESEDIRQVGADNLSDALSLVPGMVVRTNSRGEAKLSTRGLAEREIVVLVDGVPISDPYTGSVNSAMILSGAIGKISVTKGPAASVYGANALGGIIEVTTTGSGRTGLSYLLSAGSDGRYSGFVSGGGGVGHVHLNGGLSANGGSEFGLPGSYTSERWEDGGTRDFSAREDIFAWGSASWRPSGTVDASISMQVADGRRDVPASTSADRPRFWRFPYWRETRTVGSVGWKPSDALFVESKVFYGTNDNQLAAYSDFERTDRRWLSSVSNRVYGGYVYSELDASTRQRLSAGLNIKRDVASLQSDIGEEWRNHEAVTMSLFGQDVVVLGRDDLVAVAVNADAMVGEGASLVRVNPQASWSRRLPADYTLRVLGGMKTRFPTLKEWFSLEIGNPDLRPEMSTSVEAEIAKRIPGGSRLSVLVFEQWVKDMIVSAGGGDPCRNVGSVTSWGAEVGARHSFFGELDVDLSAAMTSARDARSGTDVPYVPKTMLVALATYSRGPATCLARVTRVGSRPESNGDGLPPYVQMDLRGTYATAWGDFFVGVENALDVLYEDEEGFPQAGRRFEFGVMRELYH